MQPDPQHRPARTTHAAVREYFAALEAELRNSRTASRWRRPSGRALAEEDTDHHRRWQAISAVLLEQGLPFLADLKPLPRYRQELRDVIAQYLANHGNLLRLMELDVDRAVAEVPDLAGRDVDDVLRAPPQPGEVPLTRPDDDSAPLLTGVDYLGREQRNRSLASAGEAFVLALEQQRLLEAGCDVLAGHVEHVSGDHGESLGYDLRSYELDGRERLIQVKTTRYRKETPFYLNAHEVAISALHRERYWIYRVYNFRDTPCVYAMNGPLQERFHLQPHGYRATLR
jgi:hypothetical protein